MNLFETIRTAFESLTSNLLRTLLTMLGVIIGVASVVTLMSLGSGVQGYITGQLQSTGTNLLSISADASKSDTQNARLTNDDVRAISNRLNVPEVVNVVAQVSGNLNVSAGTHSSSRSIVGTTPGNFPLRNINIAQGALFTENDNDIRARVVVLGYQAARDLFPINRRYSKPSSSVVCHFASSPSPKSKVAPDLVLHPTTRSTCRSVWHRKSCSPIGPAD